MMTNDVIKKAEKRLKELEKQRGILEEQMNEQKYIIVKEIMKPYNDGDECMFTVNVGRTKKKARCKLEFTYDRYTPAKAYPYKQDGTLSSKGYNVYMSDVDKLEEVE